jgi:hypothetical protein
MEEKPKTSVNFIKIVSLDFNCLIYVMNIKLKLSKQLKTFTKQNH